MGLLLLKKFTKAMIAQAQVSHLDAALALAVLDFSIELGDRESVRL